MLLKYTSLPIVSVIIPAYNHELFITEALGSVFRQTYPADLIEIIAVDDGSTDRTRQLIERHAGRVKLLSQENRGVAAARNAGLAASTGEIVTFLDSDDIWHEERIEKVVQAFRKNPDAVFVYHAISLIDRSGGTIARNFHRTFGYREHKKGWIAGEVLSGRVFCGGSSFAFRRDVLDSFCPLPEEIRRGVDFYMTVLASCRGQAEYVPDVLGRYRLHSRNITFHAGNRSPAELAEVNRHFAEMRQRLLERMEGMQGIEWNVPDLSALRRLKAKEWIFSDVLSGQRAAAIRRIPGLFSGELSFMEFLSGTAVALMTLFLPAALYPGLVRTAGRLKLR